jgi:hypothetical protein
MCSGHPETAQQARAYEKKYRLADFFNAWWDTYAQSPREYIQPEQYKAVNAIRTCRTPALGVDIYACPECGEVSEVYHSCKNRFCPTCSWQDTVRWAERVKGSMLNLPHRHVVFTLPHELNGLIKRNGKRLLDEFMRTTADVLKDWMAHKHRLKPGIISVLHTFGEVKTYHPHLHMIVSWGGIHLETGRLTALRGDYVHYDFLQTKFRCKFEDALLALFDAGTLEHSFKGRADLLGFVKRINRQRWVIHLEPPMEIPSTVVRYIGRYSKRACLSEYKITAIDGENIRFRYKDYKDTDHHGKPKEKELELPYWEFFPRLLQHVPLPYFKIVRYYGVYGTASGFPEEYRFREPETGAAEPGGGEKDLVEASRYCTACNRRKEYQHTVVVKRVREWRAKPGEVRPNLEFTYKRAVA